VGIILSLILMAVGAILTWGVNSSGGSVDVDVVGVVLMVVGYWPTRRRTTYVEEEPPAGPPY
jgi:uncharacterized membrane protein